jgi:hypothetical protein
MPVYVLVAAGIYDQGVVGVYATEDDARAAAEKIWPQTDGYHGFDIREYHLGATRENAFPYGWSDRRIPPKGPARITSGDYA